jgi:hypothetical protein
MGLASMPGCTLRPYQDSDPALRPYFWYKRFLVEGAREHSLPAEFSLSIGCELKI